MEEAERRRTQEKERRLQEFQRLEREKAEAAEIIAARAFAQSYLASLIPAVHDSLASNGYFHDKIERELELSFLPWLTAEVDKSLGVHALAVKIADGNQTILIALTLRLDSLGNQGLSCFSNGLVDSK